MTMVALYARCSTLLSQDPENQLIHLRELAKARGFTIIREFVDHGISGAKEKRPALDELIKMARNGKFSLIITASIDRLARDTRHLLNLIDELSHYGVAIVSHREGLDFSTPIGKATLTIIGAIAALERELIRERIKNSLAAKKLAGEKNGIPFKIGRPPVVDSNMESKVLELKARGLSVRAIAEAASIGKSSVQRILKAKIAQSQNRKKNE